MAAKPIWCQIRDTNGNPYAGAKLYVYEAGTSTPRTIYTESGLGTSSANPAIGDANGVITAWVDDTGGDIKVVAKNSADSVTAYSQDNIDIATLDSLPIITWQSDQQLGSGDTPTFAGLTLTGGLTGTTATFSGNVTLSSANIDLDGNDLIIDADADSYLHQTGDDALAMIVGGTSVQTWTPTGTALNGAISGDAFLDEDDMASDSATKLASQQSIKAYVNSVAIDPSLSNVVSTEASAQTAFDAGSSIEYDGVSDIQVDMDFSAATTNAERFDVLEAAIKWRRRSTTTGGGRIMLGLPEGLVDIGDEELEVEGAVDLGIEAFSEPSFIDISGFSTTSLGGGVYEVTCTVASALPSYVVADYAIGIHPVNGDNDAEAFAGAAKVKTIAGDRLSFTYERYFEFAPTDPTTINNGGTQNGLTESQIVVPRSVIAWSGGSTSSEGLFNLRRGARFLSDGVGWSYNGTETDGTFFYVDAGAQFHALDRDVFVGGPERIVRGFGGIITANRACFGGINLSTCDVLVETQGGGLVRLVRCCLSGAEDEQILVGQSVGYYIAQCVVFGGNSALRFISSGNGLLYPGTIGHATEGILADSSRVTIGTSSLNVKSCTTGLTGRNGGSVIGTAVFSGNTTDTDALADQTTDGFSYAASGTTTTTPTDFDALGVTSVTATAGVTGATVTATGAVSGDSVAATNGVTGATVTATGAVSGDSVAATNGITGNSVTVEDVNITASSPLLTLTDSDNSLYATLSGASGNCTFNISSTSRIFQVSIASTNKFQVTNSLMSVTVPMDMTGSGYQVNGTQVVGAQGSAITSLTDSTGVTHDDTIADADLTDSSGGTADGTVSAVSGSGDDTNINNNFAECVASINALEANDSDLAAKVEEILGALRTHGLIAT